MQGERQSYAAAIWKKLYIFSSNMKSKTIWTSHNTFMYVLFWRSGIDVQYTKGEILPMFRGQFLKAGLGRLGIWALLFLSFICHSLSLRKVEEGYYHQVILFCTKKTGMYCLLMVRQICWPLPVENPNLYLTSGSFHLTFPDHFITVSMSNAKLGLYLQWFLLICY